MTDLQPVNDPTRYEALLLEIRLTTVCSGFTRSTTPLDTLPGRSYASAFPHKPPSVVLAERKNQATQHSVPEAMPRVQDFVHAWLVHHLEPSQRKTSNAMVLCLWMALELLLSTPTIGLLYLHPEQRFGDLASLKSFGNVVPLPIRFIWSIYRFVLNAQRSTSLQLERFEFQHFSALEPAETRILADVFHRFRIHLRNFEIAEESLRDRIAAHNSLASTKMAEQSIKESKRGMLCRFSSKS